MNETERDQAQGEQQLIGREAESPLVDIFRFQGPIIIRRFSSGGAFPLLLKEPSGHQEEADFIYFSLETLYVEREMLESELNAKNPGLSKLEFDRLLKRDAEYNHIDGDINFLQGSSRTSYAIELIEGENGEIVRWAPELQEPSLNIEERWWSIIRKDETFVAEYDSLNEDFPEGIEWCKKYLAARIKEHVFYESGALETFKAEYRDFLKDDEDNVIGNRLVVLMAAISADFAARLR